VPNAQLIKEGHPLVAKYKGKSVAEQHSFDVAWALFMSNEYTNLRQSICSTDKALLRFHDMVLNLLSATDIADKELKMLRDARWAKAFAEDSIDITKHEDEHVKVNRKATIVVEHLIQSSDISHTMQHWHIYRTWNEKFFMECTKAYKEGRADKDPVEYWYKGEIGFFDFYIIPLARKLATCGVFGVSSDEYINYAVSNRQEWEERGEAIVKEMAEKAKAESWYTNPVKYAAPYFTMEETVEI